MKKGGRFSSANVKVYCSGLALIGSRTSWAAFGSNLRARRASYFKRECLDVGRILVSHPGRQAVTNVKKAQREARPGPRAGGRRDTRKYERSPPTQPKQHFNPGFFYVCAAWPPGSSRAAAWCRGAPGQRFDPIRCQIIYSPSFIQTEAESRRTRGNLGRKSQFGCR